ncbi:interleukin-1 receptor-associated kinase 1 isoform X2 [Cyprinodon tularosa]|uniref:interleukin-1 receptor-associated kinase 1 isoform X2 n=1 Tax=Cyprinodon tularosa TaxID=77115 RepID=UPI0018E24D11|nr:interleukin-1 receptor-associated kinase 1 isoform X2 [Cyprinodon tularosa]
MSELRAYFLYQLPTKVHWEFCRVMDGLLDLDWTRFASEVLRDQTAVRLAERRERRTDWVMNQWENRNGRVGDLIDLLEELHLFRARDVILSWRPTVTPFPPPALPPPPLPPPPPPPLEEPALPTEGGKALPGPAPPPDNLHTEDHQRSQEPHPPAPAIDDVIPPPYSNSLVSAAICWSYEEVHAGTQGFSPSLQVGEGGFGVVYRASLRNMDCAVKRLRQDSEMDWTRLRKSFQTEVENLSKFRHLNIVDLLGFSEGTGGLMCLIYSYMENRSLEDQLHNACEVLSWPLRVSIVEGAAAALQFLHHPPSGQEPLIHGDVKSSNILLDQHWVPKLSDFGLARYVPRSSADSATQTTSVGKTTTVRGTLAYLPDEYVRRGELCMAVDVYSFGVVLLEVLTGRRALERDKKCGERYLRDLVDEVDDGPNGSSAEAWRRHLDRRLIGGGTAEPDGYLQMATLAQRNLSRQRKKRPTMTEVFHKLRDIGSVLRRKPSSSVRPEPPRHSSPRPPRSLDSCITAVSQQLSKLGPLEATFPPSQYYSSSSSSFGALTPPHPLHSSSLSHLSCSLAGPCETDESRGFSQYELRPQLKSNGTSCQSKNKSPAGPGESQLSQPSVPTEDQYNYPSQPSSTSSNSSGPGAAAGSFSPAGSLQSNPAGLSGMCSRRVLVLVYPIDASSDCVCSVLINPSKQRLLEKKTQYEEEQIRTTELLSLEDLYGGGRSSEELRGPEESDELEYLPGGGS